MCLDLLERMRYVFSVEKKGGICCAANKEVSISSVEQKIASELIVGVRHLAAVAVLGKITKVQQKALLTSD